MPRYASSAPWYDVVSAEPFYRVGRRRAIPALHLPSGARVLDVGCGTGLNLPLLLDAVGTGGQVVGVDSSPEMLAVARRRAPDRPVGRAVFVQADAQRLDPDSVARAAGTDRPFDAVLFTYSLSLMADWEQAWQRAMSLVRPGGRAAVVDMQAPVGLARLLTPAAALACWLGGSDITARPWTALERDGANVRAWSLRGGHIQVRVGTL